MLEEGAPGGAHEVGRTDGSALVDLHDEDAADAHALHGLEVGCDPVAGNVPVEPEPINPGTRLRRRLGKAFLERVGGGAPEGQTQEREQEEKKRGC